MIYSKDDVKRMFEEIRNVDKRETWECGAEEGDYDPLIYISIEDLEAKLKEIEEKL